MYHNRAKFPSEQEQALATLIRKLSYFMLSLVMLLLISIVTMGTGFWTTPVLEWTTVLLNMNFFTFINFTNPFYDSIHPYYHL